jgi:L-lactate utilization protein LutB
MEIEKAYDKLRFNIYMVEVGVVWVKELDDIDDDEYECYSCVYDKKHGYCDENVGFELDYNNALEYAKNYVKNGVNGTYAIISKLDFDSKEYDMSMQDTLYMVQTILGGAYIEEYINLFEGEIYELDNVVYSLWKVKDKEHDYPNNNGEIEENFIRKENK